MHTVTYSANRNALSFFIRLFFVPFFFIVFLSSCGVGKKATTYYFKNLKGDTTMQSLVNENFEELIKKKDIIAIKISAISPDDDRILNSTQLYSASEGTPGYLVDSNGNVQLHLIGTVHAEGLSLRQLSEKIKKELNTYVKDPIVVTEFLNKKILVFGQVKNAQIIPVTGNKANMTVLEALTLAGGISEIGDNKNVLIIREEKGKKTFKHLNFEDVAVLNSSWYNLRPDDIVFVSEDASKSAATEKAAKRQFIISTVLASVSFFLIIYDRLIK